MDVTSMHWAFLLIGIVVGMWFTLVCMWIQESIEGMRNAKP